MSEAIGGEFVESLFILTDERDTAHDAYRSGLGSEVLVQLPWQDGDRWADLNQAAATNRRQLTVHAIVVRRSNHSDPDQILLSWDPQHTEPLARGTEVSSTDLGPASTSPLWLLGRAVRELTGGDASTWLHPHDLRDIDQVWAELLGSPGESRDLRVRLHSRTGGAHRAKLRVTNALHEEGTGAVIVSIVEVQPLLDLVNPGQSHTPLRGSGSAGVWVIDAAGRTLDANERVAEMVGAEVGELRRSFVWDYLDGRASRFVQQHMTATNTSDDDDYQLRFVSASGAPIAAHLSSTPFLDSAGDVQGTVLTLVEVPLPNAAPGGPAQGQLAPASRSEHSDWSLLTQRERAIVELLIAGERVPAIAKMLFVSNSTVRSQLSSVFHKLGVGSQQELIHLLR